MAENVDFYKMDKYSVLMSVYYKENPEHLRQSMESIWKQTISTDDFVLVCDGPLNAGLDTVIEEMQKAHYETLQVIRLEKHGGLGRALNTGIKLCKNELVARMDSDDISRQDRCERQLDVFNNHPGLSLCSGVVEEFTVSTENIKARRVPPESYEEIIAFSKRRNPFNHPCVMFRKTDVAAVGGYQDFYLLEDYYLWVRMLLNGYQGYNIQEPLLWMRAGSDMYKRRAGWKYAKSQKALFKYMKDQGFINGAQYLMSVALRTASSITPNWLREFMFMTVMRKKYK